MAEQISADFVRQVRLALEVLAGENSMSPTDELSPLVSAGGAEAYFQTTMLDQSSNLATNDHVEFNGQIANDGGGFIALSSGAGQAQGLITLAAEKKYILMAGLNCIFGSAAGIARFQWAVNSPGPFLDGNIAEVQPATFTLDRGKTTMAMMILDLVGGAQSEVELRIVGVSGLTSIVAQGGNIGQTFALIHEF